MNRAGTFRRVPALSRVPQARALDREARLPGSSPCPTGRGTTPDKAGGSLLTKGQRPEARGDLLTYYHGPSWALSPLGGLLTKGQRPEARGDLLAYYHGPSWALIPLGGRGSFRGSRLLQGPSQGRALDHPSGSSPRPKRASDQPFPQNCIPRYDPGPLPEG
ncbi:hypothetical protein Holit_02738 [Hollandina sp. SP2]